jgi:predicted transcriptional regulator
MPDGHLGSSHISLRVPTEVVEAFDKLAAALDRPRSWVMVRALRCYLEEEGAEIFEDSESIAELDRGERGLFEDSLRSVREIIERGRQERVRPK